MGLLSTQSAPGFELQGTPCKYRDLSWRAKRGHGVPQKQFSPANR
jgi:hypothetical protein